MTMTADPAARLAEIRARRVPGTAVTLARLIDAAAVEQRLPDGSNGPAIVHGCVVNDAAWLRETVGRTWLADLPALLAFAENTLVIANNLDVSAARLGIYPPDTPPEVVVERCDRAAGMLHTAEDIRAALAAAFAEHPAGRLEPEANITGREQ